MNFFFSFDSLDLPRKRHIPNTASFTRIISRVGKAGSPAKVSALVYFGIRRFFEGCGFKDRDTLVVTDRGLKASQLRRITNSVPVPVIPHRLDRKSLSEQRTFGVPGWRYRYCSKWHTYIDDESLPWQELFYGTVLGVSSKRKWSLTRGRECTLWHLPV